jgi:hypothetical protein
VEALVRARDAPGVPPQPLRDAAVPEVPADPVRAGVVRHEREIEARERGHHAVEVPHAGPDVRHRVERIGVAEAGAQRLLPHGRDEELHQPPRPGAGHRVDVEARLHVDDGQHEQRVHPRSRGLLEDGTGHDRALRGVEAARPALHLVIHPVCDLPADVRRRCVRRDGVDDAGARLRPRVHDERSPERDVRRRRRGGLHQRAGGRAGHSSLECGRGVPAW